MQPTSAPETVELTGPLRSLKLPEICANCGAPATGKIQVERAFAHPREEVRGRFVPFCAACLAIHAREVKPMPTLELLLTIVRTPLMVPVIGFSAVALWFALEAIEETVRRDLTGLALMGGLAALFSLIAAGSLIGAWRTTRARRVIAQTSISSAFDFGPDISSVFESERRRYTIRSQEFTGEFLAANRKRLWTAGKRQRAASRRFYAAAIGGILLLGFLLWQMYREWSGG